MIRTEIKKAVKRRLVGWDYQAVPIKGANGADFVKYQGTARQNGTVWCRVSIHTAKASPASLSNGKKQNAEGFIVFEIMHPLATGEVAAEAVAEDLDTRFTAEDEGRVLFGSSDLNESTGNAEFAKLNFTVSWRYHECFEH